MITVDVVDLNTEDETGYVWTFLGEARDPTLIVPGAVVVAGDEDAPAVAVVALPGVIDSYLALARRITASA